MKKPSRPSPIKAKIVGWNPVFHTSISSVLNSPLSNLSLEDRHPLTFSLKEWKEFTGTPLEERLQSFTASNQYCSEADLDDLKSLIQGNACRILLSEQNISKYIAEKLLDHIPAVSKTYASLKRLLPDIAGKQPGRTKAIKILCRLTSEAPEFEGKAGNQLLHQAFLEAYKERREKLSQMYEGHPEEDYCIQKNKDPTCYYSHRFYDEWSYWQDINNYDHWIEWQDAYQQASHLAARELDRNPEILSRYNPNLAFLQREICEGFYKKYNEKLHLYEPDVRLSEIFANRLRTIVKPKLEAERRPDDAKPITDDVARGVLYKQREAIVDPQARRVVDFILGREDVCITYVGGSTTHLTENGERAGGSAGCYPHKGFYPIEISTDSTQGTLAHECTHTAINITYKNDAKPFANYYDRKLFVQALRGDTRESGVNGSELRKNLGITKRLYEYKDFAAEIPAYIIGAKANGRWTPELAEKYPYLTAYVEKIVLPDIELRAKGKEGFVPRPDSIEQLVLPDWPPASKTTSTNSWTGRAGRGHSKTSHR